MERAQRAQDRRARAVGARDRLQDDLRRRGGIHRVAPVRRDTEARGEARGGRRQRAGVGQRFRASPSGRRAPRAARCRAGRRRSNWSPTMIATRGPSRARSALTSEPPAQSLPPITTPSARARATRPTRAAYRCASNAEALRPSDPDAEPDGRAPERIGHWPRVVIVGVEQVDAREPQPLREQRQCDALDVGAADDPSVVARARGVVAVQRDRAPGTIGGPRVRLGSLLDGLISASGPPGARLRIGIWS